MKNAFLILILSLLTSCSPVVVHEPPQIYLANPNDPWLLQLRETGIFSDKKHVTITSLGEIAVDSSQVSLPCRSNLSKNQKELITQIVKNTHNSPYLGKRISHTICSDCSMVEMSLTWQDEENNFYGINALYSNQVSKSKLPEFIIILNNKILELWEENIKECKETLFIY